jgi:hypothetical protein
MVIFKIDTLNINNEEDYTEIAQAYYNDILIDEIIKYLDDCIKLILRLLVIISVVVSLIIMRLLIYNKLYICNK